RQKDINERTGTERQVGEDLGECVRLARPAEMCHHRGKSSQSESNCAEQYGRWQLQISGERLTKADDSQQSGNDGQHKGDDGHGRREPPNSETRRFGPVEFSNVSYRRPPRRDTKSERLTWIPCLST